MAIDAPISILVVDDSSTMARIISNLLQQLGFKNVDEAPGASSALAMMRKKHYDLVISDWNMEPMTGYDLLREIRADQKIRTTRFIMVTSESRQDNVVAAKGAGADNYIVKPFNAETLHQKIKSVFAHAASPPQT